MDYNLVLESIVYNKKKSVMFIPKYVIGGSKLFYSLKSILCSVNLIAILCSF